jgi:hypothetical protein
MEAKHQFYLMFKVKKCDKQKHASTLSLTSAGTCSKVTKALPYEEGIKIDIESRSNSDAMSDGVPGSSNDSIVPKEKSFCFIIGGVFAFVLTTTTPYTGGLASSKEMPGTDTDTCGE